MAVIISEDPFETKKTLTGVGQPSGLRNIPFRMDPPKTGENPIMYGTKEGVISTDPNVGAYNRAATLSQASPALQGASPPGGTPPPGVSGAAAAAVPPAASGFSKVAGGLRAIGGGLMRAIGPAIGIKTGVEGYDTPTSTYDERVKALGGDTSIGIGNKLQNNPIAAGLRYGSIPFFGTAMQGLANFDPQAAADVETRTKGMIINAVPGLEGVAERRVAAQGLRPSAPAMVSADQATKTATANTPTTPASPTVAATTPGMSGVAATPGSDALSAEIAKIGRNPFKGIRGTNFYGDGGTQTQLASNIADELGQRAKVRALLSKYGTDTSAANNAASIKAQMLQMQLSQANKNQDELKTMFDRTATVPTLDKDGKQTGTTIDPALRSRAEDFARNAVAGWDQLSPEQRAQGFEGVRHKFLLQELMNSGEPNALGNFMSYVGLADQLGGYTAQPLKVKAIRSIGVGDLGQKNAALTSVVSGRPYVEFENGKLYPLQDVMNTPELKSAFESRVAQSGKLVQDQYKKYTNPKGK